MAINTEFPISQMALLAPKDALEKALMRQQKTKRLNHNFWGYDFSSVHAENSLVYSHEWGSKLAVNYWLRVLRIRTEYPVFQLPEHLTTQKASANITQKQTRLLFKNGNNIYFMDMDTISDEELKDILNEYLIAFFKRPLLVYLREQQIDKIDIDAFDKKIAQLLTSSVKEQDVLCQILFSKNDTPFLKGRIQDLNEIRKKKAKIDKMSRNELLQTLNESMEAENISKAWTTQDIIDKVESPNIKLVWTIFLLLSDLTMYNSIDQINIEGFPALLPYLHAVLSISFTVYCFINWYATHQDAQYKKYHGQKTCLDASNDSYLIRMEAHVLALQVGVLSLCAYLLMTEDLGLSPPEPDWQWGVTSAAVSSVAVTSATYLVNRFHAKDNKFNSLHYLATFLISGGAGACFGMSTTMAHLDLLEISQQTADLLAINSERTLLLIFCFGLFIVSANASVARGNQPTLK